MPNERTTAAGTLVDVDTRIQSSFDALVSAFSGSLQELRALSMLRLEGKISSKIPTEVYTKST